MKQVVKALRKPVFIVLFCLAVLILLFSLNEDVVEKYYSGGIYEVLGAFFRIVFGWMPYSMGDLLYFLIVVFFVWRVIQGIQATRKRTLSLAMLRHRFFRLIIQLLALYVVFNFFWGLNYDRKPIAAQIGITATKYSEEDLVEINNLLVEKANDCKRAVVRQKLVIASTKELLDKTYRQYQQASALYPLLKYKHRSIKKSLFGVIGNYLGFSGYYNPFTGEAQINTTIPSFLQPFVACHEVAHQLGYAKENEANFAGYLAATSSDDSLFMYSAYLDLFMYANRNLRSTDSVSSKQVLEKLDPSVKQDIHLIKAFYKKYDNPVEPYITWLYGKYLESNRQPSGILSYNEVVGDVIGFYKKYGRIGGK